MLRYRIKEQDIIQDELDKLIQAGKDCFETRDDFDYSVPRQDNQGKRELSKIIEMFMKIKKIKVLLNTLQGHRTDEFKMFIRTNKNTSVNARPKQAGHGKAPLDQHITHFGVHCLNPSHVFKQLLEGSERPRSIILTSGTLSPMKILQYDLNTEFRVKLVNEHFIRNS